MYCDTSALLKLYVHEPGSDQFNRAVEGRTDLVVSDLTVTELVSALVRRVRSGGASAEHARRVRRAVVESMDAGVYQRLDLSRDVHRRAEHLLLTLPVALRAADALHLALALTAHAASMAVFDTRLATAARAVGLAVYPA